MHGNVPVRFGRGRLDSLGNKGLAAYLIATDLDLRSSVERTPLFSLRENAIAKEPGLRYPERWPCVSRLGCSNGGSASFEASP